MKEPDHTVLTQIVIYSGLKNSYVHDRVYIFIAVLLLIHFRQNTCREGIKMKP